MDGIRVVDVGFWVAGPSCGAILADWGADVVKVEPPAGDPFRSIGWLYGPDTNPPFELDNRGKRSIALDYATPAGRDVMLELVRRADVFVTNLRPGGLERAGLDSDSLAAVNPRLVYASITGYGLEGPDRDRPAYDMGAFWARAGVAAALATEGTPYPYQRGGMGDHMTGMAAAGGVAAALLARERTGRGQLVSSSLLRLGMFMMGWDTSVNLRTGQPTVPTSIDAPPNPLINVYTCGDGRAFWMLGLEGDRHWPNLVAALGRPGWTDDPRFASTESRLAHAAELTRHLQEAFRARARAEWIDVFDREGVWWSPLQATHETIHDPQALAAGGVTRVPRGDGSTVPGVATPVDFGATPWRVREMVPELGQHTELVLVELGFDWDRIAGLREAGVIA